MGGVRVLDPCPGEGPGWHPHMNDALQLMRAREVTGSEASV
jgi:hypothetical protein